MRAVVVFESLARVPRADLLWEMLEKAGLNRTHCDIAVAVPEEARDCKRRQIVAGRDQLRRAIGSKAAVLLVGNVALEAITDKKGIKQKRGRPWEEGGCIYLPCLPPGAALYDDRVIPMMEADLRLFADVVKKGKVPREDSLDWTIVDTRAKFDSMVADLKGTVSFDIETTGLYPWKGHLDGDEWVIDAKVVSIGFGTRDRQWCLPLNHPEAVDFGLTHAQMLTRIDRKIQDCYLVAQNGKFDSLWLKVHYGLDWRVDFDTMLAHWMLDENARHGLKLLAQMYFGAPNYDADLDTKTGAGPIYQHCLYLAHDVYYTRALRFKFGKLLDADGGVARAFEKIMMPIARLFVDIEFHGVHVDVDRFEEAEVYLRDQMAMAERALHKAVAGDVPDYVPGSINWRSPQQLAKLFFETLGLSVLDRTDGGSPSTNESVLKRLDHPAAVALVKYRGADQMLKMFIDGWRPYLVKHADGWRLHPSFKLHGTVTGRASCEHPNLQQVPRESLIRSLIGAPDGWELVEIDLSQIEMRIAAELSGDRELLRCFDGQIDVHWRTMVSSITGGGGDLVKATIQTSELFCLRCGLSPSQRTAKVLLTVLKESKGGKNADKYIQACRREWSNKESGHRKRWKIGDFSGLAGWLKVVAEEEVSEELVRALREYLSHSPASFKREPVRLEGLQFGDALSILSSIGPQLAEGFDDGWKEARKKAKAVGFGFLFGMWFKKFAVYARDNYGIDMTEAEAKKAREQFFNLYSSLAPWHERQRRYAQRHGHVRSLSGALRRLPAAMSQHDSPERGEALRQAINSPVQRFACELNFMVLLQLVDEFGLGTVRPIGTVHDAVLIEVRSDVIAKVYTRAMEIMTKPNMLEELGIRLRVPIAGEAKVGNWSKGISLEKYLAKVKS